MTATHPSFKNKFNFVPFFLIKVERSTLTQPCEVNVLRLDENKSLAFLAVNFDATSADGAAARTRTEDLEHFECCALTS